MALGHNGLSIRSKRTPLIISGLVAIVSALLVSASLFILSRPLGNAAAQGDLDVSVGIKTIINLSTTPDAALAIPINPSSQSAYSARKLSVNVSTNNLTGFTTTMNASATPGTGLVNASANNSTIPSTAGTVDTPTALGLNTWGFAVPKTQSNTTGLLPNNPTNTFDNTYSEVSSVDTHASKYAGLPASSSPLILKATTVQSINNATDLYFGTRVDLNKPSGSYTGTLVFSALANYVPVPKIDYVYLTNTTTHAWGPIAGGTVMDIIGEDLSTASQIFIDKNGNGTQDSGEQCTNPTITDTKITCTTPAHTTYETRDVVVNTIGGQATKKKGFYYQEPVEEIWGFSVDTSISTNITFRATAPVPLQVDFGNGSWVNFAQGATITGTAVPTSGVTPLSKIRVRPQDATSYNWFPIGTGASDTNVILSPINHLKTLDYSVTTRSISNSNGTITKPLAYAFYGATNLTSSVSFANSNGVKISGAIGSNFLYVAHFENTSLTSPIDLSPLAGWDVTAIGSDFLGYTHYDNPLLTSPIDLSPLAGWGVTAIGDIFLNSTHYGNSLLTSPIDLTPLAGWDVSGAIGSHFLYATHYGNSLLTSPIDLSPLAGWSVSGAIGNYFLFDTHSYNSSLTSPIDLSPLAGWSVSGAIGSSFLSRTHYNNTSLTSPIDLSPLAGWSVSGAIGNYFLYSTHYNNSSLTSPIDLSPLAGWGVTGIGTHFLYQAHYNNTKLLDISSFRLPNWAKDKVVSASSALYRTFYLSSSTTTTGGEPRFMDGTYISSAGSPADNRETYTNRSSITPESTGWK